MKKFTGLMLISAAALLASCGGAPAPVLADLGPLVFTLEVGTSGRQTLTLKNTGSAPLDYTLSSGAGSWLQVTSGQEGQVAAGAEAQATVQATCGAEPGTFTGVLRVAGAVGRDLPVTLTCTADTTPDAFTFTAVQDVPPGQVVTSNAVTLSGLAAPAPVSVTGGTLIVNGQESNASTVKNGDTVAVKVTAPATVGASHTARVTIGGISADFTVSTPGADTQPDAFQFPAQSGVTPGQVVTSEGVTVTGVNLPVPVSVTGGTLLVNGAVSTARTVQNGDVVSVQVTAPAGFGQSHTARVSIGGVSADFTVSTPAVDTTPDVFSFPARQDIDLNAVVTSDPVTVTGLNSPAPSSVTGGTLVVNGQESNASTVKNGDTVAVKVTAPATYKSTASATVTIGGVSSTFNVTTYGGDLSPDPFSFTARENVIPGQVVTSNVITVSGIDTPAPISVTGGALLVNGVYPTTNRVRNGDTVAVQVAVPGYGSSKTATVTIGDTSASFTVSTITTAQPYGYLQGQWKGTYFCDGSQPMNLILDMTMLDTSNVSASFNFQAVADPALKGAFRLTGTYNGDFLFLGARNWLTMPAGGPWYLLDVRLKYDLQTDTFNAELQNNYGGGYCYNTTLTRVP